MLAVANALNERLVVGLILVAVLWPIVLLGVVGAKGNDDEMALLDAAIEANSSNVTESTQVQEDSTETGIDRGGKKARKRGGKKNYEETKIKKKKKTKIRRGRRGIRRRKRRG